MNKKHKLIYGFFHPPVRLFLKLKFGYTYETAKNLPENYIVLSNHVTDYDPIFVAASFPQQMYFVASEHIARWKTFFKFIDYCFAPIMRYKGSIAATTVKEVFQKVRKGDNVCIFAEGCRTWDGITCPILPSTGKMVKKARCGLVTYRLRGGYFVSPNWSNTSNTRRGPIHGAPVNIYTKEQIAKMSVDEINEIINRDLYEDAYEQQLLSPQKYSGKNLAEGMENLLFICPVCGKIDTIRTHENTVSCSACDMKFTYNEYAMLNGISHKTVRELAKWQREQVLEAAENKLSYTADSGSLAKISNHEETIIAQGKITLSSTSLICGEKEIPLEDILDMAIHGKHGLVFTAQKTYYELLPDKEFNALKFLWLYEAYKKMNTTQED
ncbi:MAG: lysophospholipid acyltransferase family protein [Ruminococcus sp.]|nr:lysophospholipid acyltransferase family protein [Ruminococcus sp.]